MAKVFSGLFCAIAILAMTTVGGPAGAQSPRQITWDDLMPPDKPIRDPFAHLAMEVVVKLHGVMALRERQKSMGLSDVSPEAEKAVEAEYELRRMGVDVERLIREYREAEGEIERLNRVVVPELDGQFVRMPGYALPLEMNGSAVTELLLVPFVGACIHVPPPPPNQMAFVKLAKPFVVSDVFAPVWITGRMTVKSNVSSVFISDGKAPVESGYLVENATIEPYKE